MSATAWTVRRRSWPRRALRKARALVGLPINFGELGATEPISGLFGFDRGTPIDRYYIEDFLGRNAAAIAGRTLEIGGDEYTGRFGSERTTRRDVLHVHERNPAATIVGDLAVPGTLPADAFDCAVITQTLHLIWDMPGALAELHRSLRPGGTLLLTVPGITSVDRHEWGAGWYWSLTEQSATRLATEAFGQGKVDTTCYGNVYAACAFLQGIALQEVSRTKLDVYDPAYPVIIGVRAVKIG